jgi:23S rRNA (cytosine1962-C5)-methyltransferase
VNVSQITRLIPRLDVALQARMALFDVRHETAVRLFNGFTEGYPDLVVDLYGASVVLHNYAETPQARDAHVVEAISLYCETLPWLRCVIVKQRNARTERERNGVLVYGDAPDRWVRDPGSAVGMGVRYATNLTLNRDASFYLDTRNLRAWAISQLRAKTVLNTFAYTGSLGVAALAGGAQRVVQLDLNRQFLNVAKTSYTLNGFPIHKPDFVAEDFFPAINRLKRQTALFDCVILDPPFFSTTAKGMVDLTSADATARLINKVRPLVRDGGWLVAINNALYLRGADYVRELEALCADGYLSIEAFIPVPEDIIGYPETRMGTFPIDPAPFNHPTKIAVLRVRRK